jgi:hypothetical protein
MNPLAPNESLRWPQMRVLQEMKKCLQMEHVCCRRGTQLGHTWRFLTKHITATFAGSANCAGSSGTDGLLITAPGRFATGAGVYSLPDGVGRVAMAFFTARVHNTYTGRLTLVNRHRWMFNSPISSYVTTSLPEGIVHGAGAVYWWKPSLSHGRGNWALAAIGVSFTATFTPRSKTSRGTFGVTIDYTPVPPQPSPLPNSPPTSLTTGLIVMNRPADAARTDRHRQWGSDNQHAAPGARTS